MRFSSILRIRYDYLLLVFVLSFSASLAVGEDKPPAAGRVLATVNGTPITTVDVNREMMIMRKKIPIKLGVSTESELSATKKEFLDRLIKFELLYQESMRRQITVSQTDFNDYFHQMRSKFAKPSHYTRYLQDLNLTETSVQTYIRRELTVNRLIQSVADRQPPVSEEEKKAYYNSHLEQFTEAEQIQIHHIFLYVDQSASDEEHAAVIEKLSHIRNSIEKKETTFAEQARLYSEDKTAQNGGELGYFHRGQLIQPLEKAAFSLNPGEISGAIISPYGYHLILVTDRRPQRVQPYADVVTQITQRLKRDNLKKAIDVILEKARESSDISVASAT